MRHQATFPCHYQSWPTTGSGFVVWSGNRSCWICWYRIIRDCWARMYVFVFHLVFPWILWNKFPYFYIQSHEMHLIVLLCDTFRWKCNIRKSKANLDVNIAHWQIVRHKSVVPSREDQVQPAVANRMVIDSRTERGKLRHLNFRKPTSSYLKCITCGIWNSPAPSWVDISKDEHDSALKPPPNWKQRNCSNPTRRPDDIRDHSIKFWCG